MSNTYFYQTRPQPDTSLSEHFLKFWFRVILAISWALVIEHCTGLGTIYFATIISIDLVINYIGSSVKLLMANCDLGYLSLAAICNNWTGDKQTNK